MKMKLMLPTGMRCLLGCLVAVLFSGSVSARSLPSTTEQEALIKTTLLTFNDANVTGNYDVFHAKLSKPFRDQFTSAKLADTFKDFRDKHLDISFIVTADSTDDEDPVINDDDVLRLRGHFETKKVRLIYDLKFIQSDGDWKTLGINVKTRGANEKD
jgi:hypothetical protein